MSETKRVPGSSWRVLAHAPSGKIQLEDQGIFDELVVDDWFHIEQMDDREWVLRLGDARIHVTIAEDGSAEVDVVRGFFHDARGNTETLPPLKR
jgi:hypothetical protein